MGFSVLVILHFTVSRPVANEVTSEQGILTAKNIKRMQNVLTLILSGHLEKKKKKKSLNIYTLAHYILHNLHYILYNSVYASLKHNFIHSLITTAYLDGYYPGFDWLVATVFLVFHGNLDRAWTFLHRFSCLGCSAYLWPARMHASVSCIHAFWNYKKQCSHVQSHPWNNMTVNGVHFVLEKEKFFSFFHLYSILCSIHTLAIMSLLDCCNFNVLKVAIDWFQKVH